MQVTSRNTKGDYTATYIADEARDSATGIWYMRNISKSTNVAVAWTQRRSILVRRLLLLRDNIINIYRYGTLAGDGPKG